MNVYIIIVTYDAEKYIKDCLVSVFSFLPKESNVNVVVVDNNSSDNTTEFIKENYPQIKLIENKENLGFAGGNNLGMKYAMDRGADYIYLLNQDTIVEEDWLNKALSLAESNFQAGAVQSLLMLWPEKGRINSWGNEIHFLGFGFAGGYRKQLAIDNGQLISKEIAYASGAAVLLRVSTLKEIGIFNPEFFMYHEDLDLGWRMNLAGYKILLAPKSIVYHKYEFSRSIKKYYYMERNRFWVLFQNYKWLTLILFLPALMVMNIGLLFSAWRGGWLREEFRAYKYYFNGRAWKNLLDNRKIIQSKRKVKDQEILKLFTGKIDFQDVETLFIKFILNPIFNLYFKICRLIIWW